MASPQPVQIPAKVHVLLGNPGYPVLPLSSRDDYTQLTVEHYEPGVHPGDGMVLGPNPESARTYVVLTNTPTAPGRWRAEVKATGFVSVAGVQHYQQENPQSSVGRDDWSGPRGGSGCVEVEARDLQPWQPERP